MFRQIGNGGPATGTTLAPLFPKPLLILMEDPGVIEPATHKGPSAKVMNKRILSYHSPPARQNRSQTVIIVLETADAKSLIQKTDRVDNLPADEQTKADQTMSIDGFPGFELVPTPTRRCIECVRLS